MHWDAQSNLLGDHFLCSQNELHIIWFSHSFWSPKIYSSDIFSMSVWVRNPWAVSYVCLPEYLEWKHRAALYQIIAHYSHCKLEPALCPGLFNSQLDFFLVPLNENRPNRVQTRGTHAKPCVNPNVRKYIWWMHRVQYTNIKPLYNQ